MDIWQVILASGAISALVSLSIGLWRDRNLETFKGELRKEVFEHETKFASHYDRKSEVISEIHTLVAVADEAIKRLGLPRVPTPKIEGQETTSQYDPTSDAFAAVQNLENYFNQNSLYLSESQAEMVSSMLQNMDVAWFSAAGFRSEVVAPETVKSSKQSYDIATGQIEKLKDRLEA